ncbi:uncharacterized protein AB9X84_007736 [Acanthopagrus schlegelii]
MLLLLSVLLAGRFCLSSAGVPERVAQQNTQVTLPCPHKVGNVQWSRFINGAKVVIVRIEDGKEKIPDKHYGSLADNSLVIRDVRLSDSTMYFCNDSRIYLQVTTDPNVVTQRNDGLNEGAAAEDPQNHRSSGSWKLAAGAVVGAALVTLVVFLLRFCPKNREETNSNVNETVTDVIYEEIEAGEEQPRRDSDVESPYYWTSISETLSTSTPTNHNLYSSVNKLKTGGHSEEAVYYLAQNPAQTGSVSL